MHQEVAKSCKICGGKPLDDKLGPLPGNMLSTVGLELSRVIDPHLNWKTASKGKPRARRRARTSFTGGNKKQPTERSLKDRDTLTAKNVKGEREMPVSESEKLGVTILGRRFSDNFENVPIKKRRFLLVRSPSPPPRSPSPISTVTERISAKGQIHERKNGTSTGVDQDIVVAHEKTNLDKISEEHFDSADFSGISILAAAACNSSVGGGGMVAERDDTIEMSVNIESHIVAGGKTEEKPLRTLEINDAKTGVSLERTSTSMFSTKEPDGIKVEESHSPRSTSSSHNVPEKMNGALGRVESSSRDERFHWDLNTVMDIWESPCEDSHPPAVTDFTSHVNNDKKMHNLGPYQGHIELGETKYVEHKDCEAVLDSVPLDSCRLINLEVELKPDFQCSTSVVEHNPFHSVDFVEGTKSVSSHEQCSQGAEVLCSPVGHTVDPSLGCSISEDHISYEKKGDTHCSSFGSVVGIVNTSSHLAFSDNSGEHAPHSCPTDPMDRGTSESVSSEIKIAETITDLDSRLCDHHLADVQRDETCCLKGPQGDKHACLHNDLDLIKINNCLASSPVAEQVSDVLSDMNNYKKMTTVDTEARVEVRRFEPFGEAASNFKDQLKEADKSSFPSDFHAFNTQSLSNCKELSSSGEIVGNGDMPAGEMREQGNECSVLVADNLIAFKTGSDIVSKDSAHDVVHMITGTVDCVNNTGEDALEDLFDCDYESDASQIDSDRANSMEKVELQGDDDSQYEDGEFRESAVHSWEADGDEEGETEYVDYGSDNRDTDVFEAARVCPTSTISSRADCENGRPLVDSHIHYGVDQVVEKDVQMSVSQPAHQVSSVTNTSHIGSGMKRAVSIVKMVPRDHKSEDDGETCAEGDVRSHSASLRMKCSGWDQLPEESKSTEGLATGVESVKRNPNGAGESTRRVVEPTLRRDLSSRIERCKTSDFSQRKNRSYIRGSRSDDPNESNPSIEGDAGHCKSIGRGGSSHMHGRGMGGDHWMESRNNWGRSRHDSPGYYGSTSFSHPGSKNAAAAAAAKVESNGLVVAPDGTVVEAGSLIPASTVTRRSSNVAFQRSHRSLVRRGSPSERDEDLAFDKRLGLGPMRDVSPGRGLIIGRGRPGRYAPRMISTGHRERYRDPMPDASIGSSMPMHHMLSRRDRSFSPHRRPFHPSPSRSKSPSRSRTRSPLMWTSPRGRNDSGMNDDPGVRRRRRTTPNYRSEGRVERLWSPQRRSGFAERMAGFAPSSRNHTSPPNASRWMDERKDLADHYSEHEYKRPSGRSPPARLFSRSQRCDFVDSPGRMKSDEYYQPLRSGRFHEFVGIDRGHRNDGGDDGRRGHGEGYEMLPSIRQYDFAGGTKRFRYDIEDGFRTHDSRSKNGPEFHRRGSPRGFDRGVDKQIGNSPRIEEKGPFRYGREGKHSASFKSFAIRECHEDLAARRRRPS